MTLTNPCGLEGLKSCTYTRLYSDPAPIGLRDARSGVLPMTTCCSVANNYTVSSVINYNRVLFFLSNQKLQKQKDIYIYNIIY